MTNCGTFYCNIFISPKYFYVFVLLFWKQLIVLLQERQMDLVEVLGFIFMLSTMELGRVIIFSDSSMNFNLMAARQEYSTENLSGTQKAMLEDLRDYGLIWQRKVWLWVPLNGFWPLRQSLHHGVSIPPVLRPPWLLLLHRFLLRPAVVPVLRKGSLFSKPITGSTLTQVFQICVIMSSKIFLTPYLDNPLQIAVLGLFVSLKYRFPNLVVGSVTRESVKEALSSGISADQVCLSIIEQFMQLMMSSQFSFKIISYLVTHAHPQMRKNAST